MKLKTQRSEFGDAYTGGKLYVNDEYFCDTIEPCDRKLEENPSSKIHGTTAIPRGTYKLIIDFSNRFQRELPHVLEVPGFEGVRIHAGNSSKDTEGCLIIGKNQQGNWVSDSRSTLARLMDKLELVYELGEQVTYEVE